LKTISTLAFLCLVGCSTIAAAQEATTYTAKLTSSKKSVAVGRGTFDLYVSDSKSVPATELSIKASLSMPSMMSMAVDPPSVKETKKPGHYSITTNLPMAGEYEMHVTITAKSGATIEMTYTVTTGTQADTPKHDKGAVHDMSGMHMKGSLGDWSMSREGSGTSWQPDSSPMYMKMLPDAGRYQMAFMGDLQAGYINAGGKRGDKQGYANSMAMWMAQRDTGGGTLGLHLMLSADPITNGKRGVPNLFQTGETLNGKPLVDRQHPHDLMSEMAVSFSKPINAHDRAFIYGGPIGEPALGNVMFMHRASGMEIPEAPISHHWFDSTHISFGVVTLGATLDNKWKVEGSAFNGHEPDENRFDIDPIKLNSASGRLSYNPTDNWSLSASYGYLKSPESLEPGLDQHRLTASVSNNSVSANGDNLASTLLFGRLVIPGKKDSNAILFESTLSHRNDSLFARFERVDKDELVGVPAGSYSVDKILFGDVHNLSVKDGFEYGVGAYVGFYSFPKSLDPFYGSHPTTIGIFLRIRPSKM